MKIQHTTGVHEIRHETYVEYFGPNTRKDPAELYAWFQDYMIRKGLSHVTLTYEGRALAIVTHTSDTVPPALAPLVDLVGGSVLALEHECPRRGG